MLVLSGVLEAVWATALDRSEGFGRLAPSLVFAFFNQPTMRGSGRAVPPSR